jgi:hypothetical protein
MRWNPARRVESGLGGRDIVGERISFLSRLILLKLIALLVFVLISLYAPSITNILLDRAAEVSKVMAQGTEDSLVYLGVSFGDGSYLTPKRGSVELAFRLIAMEKVILFIGISVVLYVLWILLVGSARGGWRMMRGRGQTQTEAARLETHQTR